MDKGRIAFLSSSFDYTVGILPFVRRLEAHGYVVNWISFRKFEYRWLLEQGVPPEQVLDTVGTLGELMDDQEAAERLIRLENGQVPFVNHIISMDRLVKLKPAAFARRYLAGIEKHVTGFLVRRGVTLVSGGRDTALQISTSKICSRLGIPFIVPTAMRLPDDRYGFCRGFTEAGLMYRHTPDDGHRRTAAAYLARFRDERPVPSVVHFEVRNNQFLRRVPRDIKLLATMLYRGAADRENDFTRYTGRQLFDMYWRRRWNAFHVRRLPPFQPEGRRPFVLFAYQMQPESGIDVLASFYSDQVTLIRQIARAVPATHDFYVKPHPDHVGGVPRSRMTEIAQIPGVTLIDPFASGRSLMHRAALIVTPAGTMAYEGALHGIPSIIFADEYFGTLPMVHRCTSPESLPDMIRSLVTSPPANDDAAIIEFLARILANTYPGRVTSYTGPFTDEELSIMIGAYDELLEATHRAAEPLN